MIILDSSNHYTLHFSLQDVDHSEEYVMVLQRVAEELSVQMECEAPLVSTKEDESGFYLVVELETQTQALNYIDLYIDLLGNPELELDLDHLQLYTQNIIIYQRFNNAKMQHYSNMIMDLFENTYDNAVEERLLELETVVEYNAVPSLRQMLNVIGQALESNGIEVAAKMNEVSKVTFH